MEITIRDFYNEEEFKKCTLPFIFECTIPSLGWDIPDYIKIDSNLNIFADSSGHGFGLSKKKLSKALIDSDANFVQINNIYTFLESKNYNFTKEDIEYFFKKLPNLQNKLIEKYLLEIEYIDCSCCNGTGKVKKLKENK